MRIAALLLMLLTMTTQATPAADFSKLGWLEGCWQGEGLGGEISECWVSSADGYYTGIFQLQHGGELSFTEIVALADFDGQPAMRVRHFNPDFTQWDSDKNSWISFPLIAIGDNKILFKGLEYRLKEGHLHISLDMKRGDGSVATQRFTLSRVK